MRGPPVLVKFIIGVQETNYIIGRINGLWFGINHVTAITARSVLHMTVTYSAFNNLVFHGALGVT